MNLPLTRLRQAYHLMTNTHLTAIIEELTAEQWLKVYDCYVASGWDITPDKWTRFQLNAAVNYGETPLFDTQELPIDVIVENVLPPAVGLIIEFNSPNVSEHVTCMTTDEVVARKHARAEFFIRRPKVAACNGPKHTPGSPYLHTVIINGFECPVPGPQPTYEEIVKASGLIGITNVTWCRNRRTKFEERGSLLPGQRFATFCTTFEVRAE